MKANSQDIICHEFDSVFPELRSFPKEVREHLGLICRKNKLWRNPQWWLRGSFAFPLILLWQLLHPFFLPDNRVVNLVGDSVTPTLIIVWIISIRPATRYCRKLLIQSELNRIRIRIPMCLMCGYNLCGTPDESTSCPECGAEIAAVVHDTNDTLVAEALIDSPAEPGAEGDNNQ
tara:strand:+ start:85 stop:609 length:525 start_codon:yes stop_codon:yes gene_type:complete